MTRRSSALLALCLGAVCTLPGCGIAPTGLVRAGEPATGIQEPGGSYTTARIFFLSPVGIQAVSRHERTPAGPQRAMDLLLAGPTPAERARGLITEVPGTIGPVRATAATGAVDVDLPVPVSELQPAAVSQIACTAAHSAVPGGRPATEVDVRVHEQGGPPWTLRCSDSGNAFPVLSSAG
ncbi:hypothetical protein ACFY2W_33415 [Streptomyces sp. NPDC001262]|uniref:hypothetical protein n=1 Tax=Streptomyces TaxID=1883 RepID=UPI0036774309